MPRTNKPANNGGDAQKRRVSQPGNGSAAEPRNDRDAIEKRAYEIYQRRGGQHGADLDDWLEAERELRPGASDVTGPARTKPKRRKTPDQTGL